MNFTKEQPYNSLPNLPPPQDVETKPVLKLCINAATALAELKGVGDVIPNQDLLIRSIGLQEARVSSEIENIVTTTDDLYRALAESLDKANPASKEVLRYQQAISIGFQKLQSRQILNTTLFCEIASTIKQTDMQIRTMPGTKIVNPGNGEIVYTPPEGDELIRQKLRALEEFIHGDGELHPLIKLAMMHYQFEAIHPFTDGNGRTGRILNILYLVQQKLLRQPVLYLSSYFIKHKNEYYNLLRNVTEDGDWVPWITFVLQGIEETSNRTKKKIFDIKTLMDTTQQEIRSRAPRAYSKDLVELIFYLPYCKASFLEETENVSRNTAMTRLRLLEEAGILQSTKMGRDVYFINKKLLNYLALEE